MTLIHDNYKFRKDVRDVNETRQTFQRLQAFLDELYVIARELTYHTTVKPTIDDDSTQDHQVGSLWIDTSKNILYVCTNPAAGAAVWQKMYGVHDKTGGVAAVGDLDGANDYVGIVDASGDIVVQTVLNDIVRAGQHTHVSTTMGGVIPDFTAIKTVTTTYQILPTDTTILCDATGGAFTITLPNVVTYSGYGFRIKKIDSSANAVTVAAA